MLILASNSPRRKQIVSLGGWPFQVIPAHIDEAVLAQETPVEYVSRLAQGKARAVAAGIHPALSTEARVILAADTAVVDGDLILGKPVDTADARHILRRLRGRTHQVFTALAALRLADGQWLTDWCQTAVRMRSYSDLELEDYLASGDAFDKAGAYAIQHHGFHPVAEIGGCFTNVMGLPLCRVKHLLQALGEPAGNDLSQPCLHLQAEVCSFHAGDFECAS